MSRSGGEVGRAGEDEEEAAGRPGQEDEEARFGMAHLDAALELFLLGQGLKGIDGGEIRGRGPGEARALDADFQAKLGCDFGGLPQIRRHANLVSHVVDVEEHVAPHVLAAAAGAVGQGQGQVAGHGRDHRQAGDHEDEGQLPKKRLAYLQEGLRRHGSPRCRRKGSPSPRWS